MPCARHVRNGPSVDAPKRNKRLNTTACPICGITVKYWDDVKRHMRTHAKNKEQMMFRCPFEDCEYKNLQKSNVENHTSTHGHGKFYICKYQNAGCPFYGISPQVIKDHLSSEHHGGTKVSQPEQPPMLHWAMPYCAPMHVVPETAGQGQHSISSSGLGLTSSNDPKECNHVCGQLPQLKSGSVISPSQLTFGPFDAHQYKAILDVAKNGCVYCRNKSGPNSVNASSWVVVLPRQNPSATTVNAQTAMNYYVQIQPQMQAQQQHHNQQQQQQQQAIYPAANPPYFQSMPNSSPASSISSLSSSDSMAGMFAESQRPLTPLPFLDVNLDAFYGSDSSSVSSSLSSTASWESLALSTPANSECYSPITETNSVPDFFENTNDRIALPQIPPFTFNQFQ